MVHWWFGLLGLVVLIPRRDPRNLKGIVILTWMSRKLVNG